MAWKVSGADPTKGVVVLRTNLGQLEIKAELPKYEAEDLLGVLLDALGLPSLSKVPQPTIEVFITPRLSVSIKQVYLARTSGWEYAHKIVVRIKTSVFDVAAAHIEDEVDAIYLFIDELRDAINRLTELEKEVKDASTS